MPSRSMRSIIRAGEGRMFINIGSCQRSQLTIRDICTIDFDGNVIEGNGKPPLEFHLHAGIYKARPEVKAVVHAHPKWSTFLTMTGHDYQPVYAQGSLVYPMPVLDSPNSINNPVMAKRLADWPGGLVVYDVRLDAMTPLAELGATLADSLADVAVADVISVTVLNDEQVRDVIAGENGIHAYHHDVVARLAVTVGVTAIVDRHGGWQEIDRPEDIERWTHTPPPDSL